MAQADHGPPLPVDPISDRLIGLYAEAEAKLDALIAGALGRGASGTARYFTNQRARVASILRQLRVARRPLSAALVPSAYRTGVSAVDRVLDRSRAFSGVHGPAMEVLAANLEGHLRYAEERIGREAEDVFRQLALENVGVAVAAGTAPRQQAADYEAALRKKGITAFVDRRGRRWTLSNYAAMVTRTTTREANSVGMKNRLIEHGRDLVEISEHRKACPICRRYQGKTFTLTGLSKNYPVLDQLPPFHPNCRHVLLPARVTFEQMEAALGLGPAPETEEIASLGVTPFRAAVDDPKGFYASGRYHDFELAVPDEAKKAGVEVENLRRAGGVWAGGGEPSAQVTVKGTESKVTKLMDALGARFEQDAVIAWWADPDGPHRDYITVEPIKATQREIEKALAAVNDEAEEDAQIQGATITPDGRLEILDLANTGASAKTIRALAVRMGLRFQYASGRGKLRFDGSDYDSGRGAGGD